MFGVALFAVVLTAMLVTSTALAVFVIGWGAAGHRVTGPLKYECFWCQGKGTVPGRYRDRPQCRCSGCDGRGWSRSWTPPKVEPVNDRRFL